MLHARMHVICVITMYCQYLMCLNRNEYPCSFYFLNIATNCKIDECIWKVSEQSYHYHRDREYHRERKT